MGAGKVKVEETHGGHAESGGVLVRVCLIPQGHGDLSVYIFMKEGMALQECGALQGLGGKRPHL